MNVAVGQFGGYPILSAASVLQEFRTQGLSTEAFRGKANQFVCPQGAAPGWGYFLMYRAHVAKLKAKGFYRLAFGRSDAYVDMPRIAYVGCQRLHGGVQEDPAAICLVRVTDRRGLMRLTSSTSRFNIRKPDAWMEFMSGSSTDEETPRTWQEAWESLWADIEELAGRVPPALPYEPHGYPDGFWYVGQTAWDAVNDFCRRLMLGLSYDPIADEWHLWELGESDKAFELLVQQNEDRLIATSENVEREAAWGVPESVRVLFRRHVTTAEDALATPVFEEIVTAADVDETIETDDGTEMVLHDDLRAEPDGEVEPDEDSDEDRAARAEERAEKFYQMARGLQPLTRRWIGCLPFYTGKRIQEVRWADFGDADGPQTIVIRRPVELWKWHTPPLVIIGGEGGTGGGTGNKLTNCGCGQRNSRLLAIGHACDAVDDDYGVMQRYFFIMPYLPQPGAVDISGQKIVLRKDPDSACKWVSSKYKLSCPDGVETGHFEIRLYGRTLESITLHPRAMLLWVVDEYEASEDAPESTACGYKAVAVCESFDTLKGGTFEWQPGACLQVAGCFCVEAMAPEPVKCFDCGPFISMAVDFKDFGSLPVENQDNGITGLRLFGVDPLSWLNIGEAILYPGAGCKFWCNVEYAALDKDGPPMNGNPPDVATTNHCDEPRIRADQLSCPDAPVDIDAWESVYPDVTTVYEWRSTLCAPGETSPVRVYRWSQIAGQITKGATHWTIAVSVLRVEYAIDPGSIMFDISDQWKARSGLEIQYFVETDVPITQCLPAGDYTLSLASTHLANEDNDDLGAEALAAVCPETLSVKLQDGAVDDLNGDGIPEYQDCPFDVETGCGAWRAVDCKHVCETAIRCVYNEVAEGYGPELLADNGVSNDEFSACVKRHVYCDIEPPTGSDNTAAPACPEEPDLFWMPIGKSAEVSDPPEASPTAHGQILPGRCKDS